MNSSSSTYLSNSQAGDNSMYGINLYAGTRTSYGKTNTSYYIRPIRKFGDCNITFEDTGVNYILSQSVNSENTIIEPPTPFKRGGYKFEGWYNENILFNFSTPITKSITLTAKWSQSSNIPIETSDYQIGDIILSDGKVLRNIVGSLTESQIEKAVAVIFDTGTGANDALGLGLKRSYGAWATSGSTGNGSNFSSIQCNFSGSFGEYSFSGDKDGYDNWNVIESINPIGAALAANNYPIFNFVVNEYPEFVDSAYSADWFIPTCYEMDKIYSNRTILDDVLFKLNADMLFNSIYWTSSQYSSTATSAYRYSLLSGISSSGKSNSYYVRAIRKF